MTTTVLQVGVKALVKNSEGMYLLLKRSKLAYPEIDNPWDIIGGRIHPGTPLFENLQRELFEETKLKFVGIPQLVAAQDILRIPQKHVVRLTYFGKVEGNVILNYKEHELFQWLQFAKIQTITGLDMYVKQLLPQLEKTIVG